MYAFLELSSSIHLSNVHNDMEEDVYQSAFSALTCLRHYTDFGLIFGPASSLYESIPHIRHLAYLRRNGITGHVLDTMFCTLQQRLLNFDLGYLPASQPLSDEAEFVRAKSVQPILVQHSLLLFLYSAFYGDDGPDVRNLAQPLVEGAIVALGCIQGTLWRNTVYWPTVVVGSYTTTAEQRERILSFLIPSIELTARAHELLHWLWDSPDACFGLEGLAMVVERRGANYCFG